MTYLRNFYPQFTARNRGKVCTLYIFRISLYHIASTPVYGTRSNRVEYVWVWVGVRGPDRMQFLSTQPHRYPLPDSLASPCMHMCVHACSHT